MAAGNSGTPLAKKLGIKEGALVATVDAPDELLGFFDELPGGVEFKPGIEADSTIVLLFVTARAKLERHLPGAAESIHPDGAIWLAWPEPRRPRRSRVQSDEDVATSLEAFGDSLVEAKG